ncbi:chymotrypsin BII-like [Penaeus japonicus]|uniref:chymotrypsin BII-like n=1 Tax=Penaeus japonicus TaxID=27405 RepID=UPI001C70C80B|nr:chymotrypsin BII-like [Penaeus japonicus]
MHLPFPAAPRIINGWTAEPHAYPYQAAISCYRFFLCGGSVVSDVHVVTAAHCVDRPGRCKVVLDGHDLKRKERSQQIIAVGETYVHPDYAMKKLVFNDIAILKLKEKIEFNIWPIMRRRRTTLISSSSSEYVQPVNLPKTSPKIWMPLIYTGWGRAAKNSEIKSFSGFSRTATT